MKFYKLFVASFCLLVTIMVPADEIKLKSSSASAPVRVSKEKRGWVLSLLQKKGGIGTYIARCTLRVPSQYKLAFDAHSEGNRVTSCNLLIQLVANKNGKEFVSASKEVQIYPENQVFVFSLDSDFGLADAMWHIKEIRFQLSSEKKCAIVMENLRIVSSESLIDGGALMVVPYRSELAHVRAANAVKVYFELDNDDDSSSIHGYKKVIFDPPNATFRERLLEGAEYWISEVRNPSEADVIIYSRARKGADSKLADLIKSGKRLIVYGKPADVEIENLCPLELTPVKQIGFASRQPFSIDETHPIFAGMRRGNGELGVYYQTHLRFGTPLVKINSGDVFAAEAGNVIQFASGIGTGLVDGPLWYDATLLRAILRNDPIALNGLRKRGEALLDSNRESDQALIRNILGKSESGWRVGMSKNNMARFGWQIAAALQVGRLENDLSISNGRQYFRFEIQGGRRSFSPGNERLKPLSENIQLKRFDNLLELWTGIGSVEYECELFFDPAWKGKNIKFVVEKGIDDIDETFLNGQKIGEVGTDVPSYWMTSRNYPIPEGIVQWGAVNRFTIRVSNLRGEAGFGSRPAVVVSEETFQAPTIAVKSLNWVSKQYFVKGKSGNMEIFASLLAPYSLFSFDSPKQRMVFEERTAQYAAWSTLNGIRIVRLTDRELFYDRKRDGAWNAPWLLLFRKNWEAGSPLLLVFNKQPQKLNIQRNGQLVSGIDLDMGAGGFSVAAGWPWGASVVRADRWVNRLPADVLSQIERGVNMALEFPIGCDEIFRVNLRERKLDVVNRFRYLSVKDDWNTRRTAFVAFPPLSGFALRENLLVSSDEKWEDFGISTFHGPILGKSGSDTIRYRVALPEENELIAVDVKADAPLHDTINDFFAGGVRWSWGGGLRREELTAAYPMSKRLLPDVQNIDMFGWNFGLTTALQGYFFLTPENRLLLKSRVRERFMEPMDLFQYKLFGRFRKEPFSQLRYPILFKSVYELPTNFCSGFGSKVQYGDNNEACTVICWIGEELGNRFGQAGLIRTNWNCFKELMRYQFFMDDYAFHSGSCRETGGGAWIDMLNGESAGLLYFSRLAKLAGDDEMAEQGIYRAAKKMIPTLARFRFRNYLEKAFPKMNLQNMPAVTGFCADSLKPIRFPRPDSDSNFFSAMDFFDFSQGAPGMLYSNYDKYVLPEVKEYLHSYAIPDLTRNKLRFNFPYLQPLAYFGEPDLPLRNWIEQVCTRDANRKKSDWGGIRSCYELGLFLWRSHGKVTLIDCRNLDIFEAEFNPTSKQLKLVCQAFPSSHLTISALLPIAVVRRNGKIVDAKTEDKLIILPLVSGENSFEIQFK